MYLVNFWKSKGNFFNMNFKKVLVNAAAFALSCGTIFSTTHATIAPQALAEERTIDDMDLRRTDFERTRTTWETIVLPNTFPTMRAAEARAHIANLFNLIDSNVDAHSILLSYGDPHSLLGNRDNTLNAVLACSRVIPREQRDFMLQFLAYSENNTRTDDERHFYTTVHQLFGRLIDVVDNTRF